MANDPPSITIGLMWHATNSPNLGIGALTLGNMALIREAAARAGVTPRFVMIGFEDPGKPHYVEGPDVERTQLSSRDMLPGGAIFAAIERCDILLDIGGGDSFTDIYGPKRLGFLLASKALAILKGKPLILSPQTIGPFDKAWARLLAGWVLRRAAQVFARDPQSLAALKELAPDAHGALSTDVAFALPFAPLDHGPGVHVGINVSGLLFNGGYSGRNEFGLEIDYPAFTRQLIAAMLTRGARVHLIPHVQTDYLPRDDDRVAIRTLAAEFPAATAVADFAGPIEAKSHIAGLDFLVGGRMHACIAAYSSGVAVVPVAYSRKFAGLFEGVLEYDALVPVTGMTTADAVTFVEDAFERREELRQATSANRERVTQLLEHYKTALSDWFARVAPQTRAGISE